MAIVRRLSVALVAALLCSGVYLEACAADELEDNITKARELERKKEFTTSFSYLVRAWEIARKKMPDMRQQQVVRAALVEFYKIQEKPDIAKWIETHDLSDTARLFDIVLSEKRSLRLSDLRGDIKGIAGIDTNGYYYHSGCRDPHGNWMRQLTIDKASPYYQQFNDRFGKLSPGQEKSIDLIPDDLYDVQRERNWYSATGKSELLVQVHGPVLEANSKQYRYTSAFTDAHTINRMDINASSFNKQLIALWRKAQESVKVATKNQSMSIVFKTMPNGTLLESNVYHSSNNNKADKSALDAVHRLVPDKDFGGTSGYRYEFESRFDGNDVQTRFTGSVLFTNIR